jgi:hypothetical protein
VERREEELGPDIAGHAIVELSAPVESPTDCATCDETSASRVVFCFVQHAPRQESPLFVRNLGRFIYLRTQLAYWIAIVTVGLERPAPVSTTGTSGAEGIPRGTTAFT